LRHGENPVLTELNPCEYIDAIAEKMGSLKTFLFKGKDELSC